MAAKTYKIVGNTYVKRGHSTSAIEAFEIVLKLADLIEKDEYKSQLKLERIRGEIGWYLSINSDYKSAIKIYKNMIDLAKSEKEDIITQCKKDFGFPLSVTDESLIKSLNDKIDEETYEKEKLIALCEKNLGYFQSLNYFKNVKTKDFKDAQMIQNGLKNLKKARKTLKKLKRNGDNFDHLFDISIKLGNIHRRLACLTIDYTPKKYEDALDEYNIGKQYLQEGELVKKHQCKKAT